MSIKRVLRRSGYDVIKWHDPLEQTMFDGIRTILDIGANDGLFSSSMRKRFPEAHIYAFEPLPECFARLNERMNGDARFKAFNIALGEEDREITMSQSSFHPSSSILAMSALHKQLYPKSASAEELRVSMRRLDHALNDATLDARMLIKIDVQGYEDHVIRGGQDMFRRADVAIIESSFVTLYEGQPLFGDIHDLMQENGLAYRGSFERHYGARGDLIYEDSLYVRDASPLKNDASSPANISASR